MSRSLDRCQSEIARATAQAGPDDFGALLGWVDWEAERWIIAAEERAVAALGSLLEVLE
jgi:hypothetical protein